MPKSKKNLDTGATVSKKIPYSRSIISGFESKVANNQRFSLYVFGKKGNFYLYPTGLGFNFSKAHYLKVTRQTAEKFEQDQTLHCYFIESAILVCQDLYEIISDTPNSVFMYLDKEGGTLEMKES